MPTVRFKTVGCRLNQAETASMAAGFEAAGWLVADTTGPCDVAVIHTCTITQGAESDCAHWARRLRREGARLVVLAGCAVEHDGEALKARTGANLIAGQAGKFSLPEQLAATFGIRPAPPDATTPGPTPHVVGTRGLVKIQDGCDFRCSYCVVPDTRGTPVSRPLSRILDEIHHLADAGYREITLTGANLGCYREASHGLVDLLVRLETIEGLDRIRIGSIESTTVERDIIDFMATSTKLCRFLHIPLQSGDDGILQRMRRRYTAAQFRETIEYAAGTVPDIGLGTDIIVGFPGESDAAHANTCSLVRDLPFSNLHVFCYSPRRGTPAADMHDPVADTTKRNRAQALITMGEVKRQAFARTFIDRPVEILVENSKRDTVGWTSQYLKVRITGHRSPRNSLITCTPRQVMGDTLIADT